MDRNNELKEIDIKILTYNYFDDIINFDLDNILIDGMPYKNILVYGISDKTLVGAKP